MRLQAGGTTMPLTQASPWGIDELPQGKTIWFRLKRRIDRTMLVPG
jgi:hypothetical protein